MTISNIFTKASNRETQLENSWLVRHCSNFGKVIVKRVNNIQL